MATSEVAEHFVNPERNYKEQSLWRRCFSYYDIVNESIPYCRMIDRHGELLDAGPGQLILDAGTGTGNVAVMLLARGANVIGLDFVESALEMCRRKAPKGDFRFADLSKPLQFPDNHFDKAACCNVLYIMEHGAREFAVREFFRVLKPGGLCAITVFGSGFNSFKIYLKSLEEHKKDHGALHTTFFGLRYMLVTLRFLYYVERTVKKRTRQDDYKFFRESEVRNLLTQAGFDVLSVERTFADQCWTVLGKKPELSGG